MKNVLIVGAGAQANVITGVLSKADDVQEIVLTDIDLNRAKGIAETNGSPKIKTEVLDASNIEEMAARMEKGNFDLVVNATIPKFVRQVLQAAYRAKVNYLDMASNEIYPKDDVPIEQLEYAEEWKSAGLLCLTGAGGDPGLSNIMAKEAVDELDTVKSIKIKDYGEADCDEPVALWSMRTYLEDMYLPSTQTVDGKPKKFPMFTGEEEYDLPDPFNKKGKFYYHDHEEGITIPLFCGKPVEYCDFKIGEPGIDMWRFMIQGLHMMDPEPIEFPGGTVSPMEMLFKLIPETASPAKQIELYESGRLESRLVLICDTEGVKDGKKVLIHQYTKSPAGKEACSWIKGTNDVSWMTSIPASIFALMMLRGQVKHTGVVPPEVFDEEERKIFLDGIAEWGITVVKEYKEII